MKKKLLTKLLFGSDDGTPTCDTPGMSNLMLCLYSEQSQFITFSATIFTHFIATVEVNVTLFNMDMLYKTFSFNFYTDKLSSCLVSYFCIMCNG